MTKIAIVPNAAGTGTFTIEAPNSNSNRTLVLPDAAGTVLTDAENNPAKLFRRDNILGTVSQSAGVPTGAIIERGSNANGEFVKYADGTQLCTFIGEVTSSNTTNLTRTFPSAFVSQPYCVGNVNTGDATVIAYCAFATNGVDSTTTVKIIGQIPGGSGTGRPRCMAIGQWF